jgi:hypothetical protein
MKRTKYFALLILTGFLLSFSLNTIKDNFTIHAKCELKRSASAVVSDAGICSQDLFDEEDGDEKDGNDIIFLFSNLTLYTQQLAENTARVYSNLSQKEPSAPIYIRVRNFRV